MSDFDPTNDTDEVASAILDGEASPEERARLDADQVLRDRVETFRAVAERVAAPVEPVPTEVREEQLGAALDAIVGGSAEVTSITKARRRSVSPMAVAAAVAAILLVPLVAFALARSNVGTSSHDSATAGSMADETVEPASLFSENAESAPEDDVTAYDATEQARSSELQADADMQSPDDLAATASAVMASQTSTTTVAAAPSVPPSTTSLPFTGSPEIGAAMVASPCDARALELAGDEATIVANFSATYQGIAVTVVVLVNADGQRAAVAFETASCNVMAQTAF